MTKFRDIYENLDVKSKAILRYLMMHRGYYVSTGSIAKKFRMDPRTAKAYLEMLKNKGLVDRYKRKKKKFRVKTSDGRVITDDTKFIRWAFKPKKSIKP